MTVLDLQRPRVEHVPEYVGSAGSEAVDLARMAGLELDPWQAMVLEHSLGERPDGKWAAFEVGVVVPRQNGKGSILEARELAGLFLLGERLIVHSAHEFSTSSEHQRRLEALIEGVPEFRRRVKAFKHSHGEESIELHGGQRLRFRTRTKSGGRGLSADCIVLDEAMILAETAIGALMPTLSARPNPQIWYTGSAVDQTTMENGVVLARIRERGHAGSDPSLAYFEWAADVAEDPSQVDDEVASDPETWAQANPALGIRITPEHVGNEFRSMDRRTFAVERLGVGDWPETDPEAGSLIPAAVWKALADPDSAMQDPVVFSFDVSHDRKGATIAAAGRREDGEVHVEIVDRRRGTGWVAARLAELRVAHSPSAVLCDASGPAAALVPDVQDADVEVTLVNTADYAKACGVFYDLVDQAHLRHLGDDDLLASIRGAVTRPLVDAWAWSRKASKLDIAPLVAATLAAWHTATVNTGTAFLVWG